MSKWGVVKREVNGGAMRKRPISSLFDAVKITSYMASKVSFLSLVACSFHVLSLSVANIFLF